MKLTLSLLLSILCLGAVHAQEDKPYALEAYVFGVSYHTADAYDFNSVNPGLGLGLSRQIWKCFDLGVVGGTYEDSFYEQSKFLLIGPTIVLGDRHAFHGTLSCRAGYFMGSSFNDFGYMPVATIGYDWFDVCFAGSITLKEDHIGQDTPKSYPYDDPHEISTNMLAVFVKFRVLEF